MNSKYYEMRNTYYSEDIYRTTTLFLTYVKLVI